MTHSIDVLSTLKRPRLLIRAAQLGVHEYNRKRDLGKILRGTNVPPVGKAFDSLLSSENHLEHKRAGGDATYSVARHVLVLMALMAETRLAQARLS